jgi:hypothetical protein
MGFLLVSVAQKYEARHQKERRGSPSGYTKKEIDSKYFMLGVLTC